MTERCTCIPFPHTLKISFAKSYDDGSLSIDESFVGISCDIWVDTIRFSFLMTSFFFFDAIIRDKETCMMLYAMSHRNSRVLLQAFLIRCITLRQVK